MFIFDRHNKWLCLYIYHSHQLGGYYRTWMSTGLYHYIEIDYLISIVYCTNCFQCCILVYWTNCYKLICLLGENHRYISKLFTLTVLKVCWSLQSLKHCNTLFQTCWIFCQETCEKQSKNLEQNLLLASENKVMFCKFYIVTKKCCYLQRPWYWWVS